MKLIANNLRGVLKNGNKYKVVFETTPVKNTKEYRLELCVYTSSFQFIDSWLYDVSLSVSNFYTKGSYIECLRASLIELENKLEVKLLKSEMQIAV